MINKISLNNFRNHINLRILVPKEKRIVVLYGKNGVGKTNVLEAISLLFTPTGIRKAKSEDIVCKNNINDYWNVIADTESGAFFSGYMRNSDCVRRIYKVNEKNAKNLNEFHKENYVLWRKQHP